MGKKNKKEKKGKGIEKTAQKTQKKAQKRVKKELAEKGEEDIENLIAEFQARDKKLVQVIEDKCTPPTPRCNMSLTAHPDKEELIMFGGEYFTGNKMFLYNDLFFYNIRKNEWHKVLSPNPPPPRSAHQAVSLSQSGGQLWVFGGEFSSHSQSQFHHYKDLWVLHLKNKRWEMINSPGGPTSRSGHRMVAVKKQLIVFGGFHDNTREYKYYNDVHAFNLETYTWVKLETSGPGPSPRSAHVMAAVPDLSKVLVYGGYSKEKVKRDVDKGVTHTDMYALVPEGRLKDDVAPVKWRWSSVKQSGKHPSIRSGLSLAVAPGNRAVLFGGVFDEEENEEQMKSVFYKDMFLLEMEKARWHDIVLRGKKQDVEKKKRRKEKGEGDLEEGEGSEVMEVTEENLENLKISAEDAAGTSECTYDDGIFKVTIGPQGSGGGGYDDGTTDSGMDVDLFTPSRRMNTLLVVKSGVLYMYGGILEDGDKQVTLADFYSLDLNKLDEWKVIIEEDKRLQVWEESDSSSSDDDDDKMEAACGGEDDDDDDDDDDSDEDMEICFDDAPALHENEPVSEYFVRCKDYWVTKAKEFSDEESLGVSGKNLTKLAKDLCKSACSQR